MITGLFDRNTAAKFVLFVAIGGLIGLPLHAHSAPDMGPRIAEISSEIRRLNSEIDGTPTRAQSAKLKVLHNALFALNRQKINEQPAPTPTPQQDWRQSARLIVANPQSELNHMPHFDLVMGPKDLSEALEFFVRSPSHAWKALKNYFQYTVPPFLSDEQDYAYLALGGPRLSLADGARLLEALRWGIRKRNFVSMTSLMELIEFTTEANHRLESPWGDPLRLDGTDKYFTTELYTIDLEAIVQWLKTKPDESDVVLFLSTTPRQPLLWPRLTKPFVFTSPQRSADSAKIVDALIANGYITDLHSLLRYSSWVGFGENLPKNQVQKYIGQVTDSDELIQLMYASDFDARIENFGRFFDRRFEVSLIDLDKFMSRMSGQVAEQQDKVRQLQFGSYDEATSTSILNKADQMSEQFNSLKIYSERFKSLGASASQLEFFNDKFRSNDEYRRAAIQGQPFKIFRRFVGGIAAKCSRVLSGNGR